MSMLSNEPKVYVNHVGFLCDATKRVVVVGSDATEFQVQDMGVPWAESLDGNENWKTVLTAPLKKQSSEMGEYLEGDFSELTAPGVYRCVLPGLKGWSYQFVLSDGVFHPLISYLLDAVHVRRSGAFENEWRGPSHLDDARRVDAGKVFDASGGWYDAGDVRKWMTTALLPALGFVDVSRRLGNHRRHFTEEHTGSDDWLTEACWGTDFILKMQDPETGMIFEEIGGGGEARKVPGMSWWYENQSGCYADNSDNRFTDNRVDSGDERRARTSYNPVVQYSSISVLLQTASAIESVDPERAKRYAERAGRVWAFVDDKAEEDEMHGWTVVRAWRLQAALRLHARGATSTAAVESAAEALLELWNPTTGYWWMDESREDHYRGIVHAAQPLIALGELLTGTADGADGADNLGKALKNRALETVTTAWETYVSRLLATNPYRFMPYGLFNRDHTSGDTYRRWDGELRFRFTMPEHSEQRVNHGLMGHWTSWAHALSLLAETTGRREIKEAAWQQLYWALGNNPVHGSFVTGVGYNHPMPHSRFHGTIVGGFMNGFRGDEKDELFVDLAGRADWSTTEYWNVPAANALQALARLLPNRIDRSRKLGLPGLVD